jgi:hypothetical protein
LFPKVRLRRVVAAEREDAEARLVQVVAPLAEKHQVPHLLKLEVP